MLDVIEYRQKHFFFGDFMGGSHFVFVGACALVSQGVVVTVVDNAVHVEVKIVESTYKYAAILRKSEYSGMLFSAMSWLHIGHRSDIHLKN